MKNKKKKNTKETTANKKVSASGSKLGEIKAFTVLSLSRRKLNCLDDEEELFRSVLITNTMKSVKQEMSVSDKKKDKKPRDRLVKRVRRRLNMLGTHVHNHNIQRLRSWRRRMLSMVTGQRGVRRFKSTDNLLWQLDIEINMYSMYL